MSALISYIRQYNTCSIENRSLLKCVLQTLLIFGHHDEKNRSWAGTARGRPRRTEGNRGSFGNEWRRLDERTAEGSGQVRTAASTVVIPTNAASTRHPERHTAIRIILPDGGIHATFSFVVRIEARSARSAGCDRLSSTAIAVLRERPRSGRSGWRAGFR